MPPRKQKPFYVGDRVIPAGSESVYRIIRVSPTGNEVDLILDGARLKRFRVPVSELKRVE